MKSRGTAVLKCMAREVSLTKRHLINERKEMKEQKILARDLEWETFLIEGIGSAKAVKQEFACLIQENSKKPVQLQWNKQRREARNGVRENGVGKEELSCRSSLAL